MNCIRFAALLTAFLPIGTQAQDSGRPLTWEDCVAIALRKNPDLASSQRALELAQEQRNAEIAEGIQREMSFYRNGQPYRAD